MADTFNGSEGKALALATAKEWAANYRASLKDPNDVQAHFFGSEIIKKILAEPGCLGIRIYYGLDDKGKKQLILAGASANEDNLLPTSMVLDPGDQNILADASFPCPPYCGRNSL